MAAFCGAVEVGADGIETDLHLSKDGVIVLSHVSSKYQSSLNDESYHIYPYEKKFDHAAVGKS